MRKEFYVTVFALMLGGWIVYDLFKYQPRAIEDVAEILGIDSVEIISVDFLESWNIQDYDVVEVYQLSDVTINTFLMNSSPILYDKYYESQLWEKSNWRKTPIALPQWDEIYNAFINVVRENNKHNELIQDILKILKEPGSFYSFYLKKNRAAVTFFVLDIKNRCLYCLYVKI